MCVHLLNGYYRSAIATLVGEWDSCAITHQWFSAFNVEISSFPHSETRKESQEELHKATNCNEETERGRESLVTRSHRRRLRTPPSLAFSLRWQRFVAPTKPLLLQYRTIRVAASHGGERTSLPPPPSLLSTIMQTSLSGTQSAERDQQKVGYACVFSALAQDLLAWRHELGFSSFWILFHRTLRIDGAQPNCGSIVSPSSSPSLVSFQILHRTHVRGDRREEEKKKMKEEEDRIFR